MKKIKNIIHVILFVCLIVLACSVSISANASTTGYFYYITTTPAEDTSTSMNFNWHSKNVGSFMEYTTIDDTKFEKAIKAVPTEKLWSTEGQANASKTDAFYQKRFVCSLTLNNLSERTKYMYRISDGVNHSDVHYFNTSGLTNNWNFMAFTDFQNPSNNLSHQIIKQMYAKGNNPALGICSGDLTGCGGDNDDWDWLVNNSAFNNFVFAAAPGDHEYWAQDSSPVVYFDTPYCFNAIYNNPKNGCVESKMENSSYYFYYNNALFVLIDLDDSNHSTYNDRIRKEVTWFDNTLKKLEGTYQYLIVAGHKSIYGSQTTDTAVRKNLTDPWRQVFDKYNVDLVLSGHDHMYSRTKQLYGNKVSTNELKGTYYLDMGSSGNKYRAPSSDLTSDGLHETVIDLLNAPTKTANGAIIDVTETEMKVNVYNTLDEKIDSFVIKAKREAKEYDFSGYNNDKFKEEVNIDINSQSGGKMTFTSTDNLKYVQNIKVLNNEGKIVCNENINFNDNKGIALSNIKGLKYNFIVTLLDGSVKNFEKMISVGELLNLKTVYEDEEFYIKFTKEVKDIANNVYKLYVDNEFVREISSDEIKNKKVLIDNNYIIGTHKFMIQLTSDGVLQGNFEVNNVGYLELEVNETEITLKENEEKVLDFYFEDGSMVEVKSSDDSVAKFENGKIKALKAGNCEIEVKVIGTDHKKLINVTVTKDAKKTGCNSGLSVEGTWINKLFVYALFTSIFTVLILCLAFRPDNKKRNYRKK